MESINQVYILTHSIASKNNNFLSVPMTTRAFSTLERAQEEIEFWADVRNLNLDSVHNYGESETSINQEHRYSKDTDEGRKYHTYEIVSLSIVK